MKPVSHIYRTFLSDHCYFLLAVLFCVIFRYSRRSARSKTNGSNVCGDVWKFWWTHAAQNYGLTNFGTLRIGVVLYIQANLCKCVLLRVAAVYVNANGTTNRRIYAYAFVQYYLSFGSLINVCFSKLRCVVIYCYYQLTDSMQCRITILKMGFNSQWVREVNHFIFPDPIIKHCSLVGAVCMLYLM